MPEYDVGEVDDRFTGRVVKSVVTPRPIAWVSTYGADGTANLAPYSTYTFVGLERPVLLFTSPNDLDTEDGYKDSARNAMRTGEFAVNLVTEDLIEEMDDTSASVDPGVSEFERAGLEAVECSTIDAPRVAAASATMECSLHDTLDVFDRIVVFGEIEHYHLDEALLSDGEIEMENVASVGRLGGPYYTVSAIHDFERQF
jgi:flavin reductase (DIM6/NTAB) family NADH-FMN oxidoreductase RutF